MKLAKLFHDERAVSPVIGVILMVAITVILAAVIGTFVLGLGDQVQQTTPRASFGSSQTVDTVSNESGAYSSEITMATLTHESGDSIDETSLSVTVDGNPAYGLNNTEAGSGSEPQATNPWDDSGEKVSAGSSFEIAFYDTSGGLSVGDTVLPADGSDGYQPSGATELASGDTVRVLYDSPDSENTATLAKYEVS